MIRYAGRLNNSFKSLLILILLSLCLLSCSYLKNRVADAQDMIDIGFSISRRPQFALYYDFVPIIPVGYGDVKGKYIGLGGGKFGWLQPHQQRSYGLILWGQEEVNFGIPSDELSSMTLTQRNQALNFQRTGLIGVVQGPFPGPDYLISCPHYIHLAWIGVIGTPRYLQMLDFLLGWTTLDICGDDENKEKINN